MLIQQQPAYVLHARPYRETSLLLECLTRDHGRLGVVARGVRGTRGQLRRADLEPFQRLTLNLQLRGELATLRGLDPEGPAVRLGGDALLGGLYVNELVVRLSARQDPHPALFEAYRRTLQDLGAAGVALAWTLRRFERDLLAALGYALQLARDADSGLPLEPGAGYHYLPEHGPRREPGAELLGSDLLDLAADRAPDARGMTALRRLMRSVIGVHLGGAELRTWRMLRALKARS